MNDIAGLLENYFRFKKLMHDLEVYFSINDSSFRSVMTTNLDDYDTVISRENRDDHGIYTEAYLQGLLNRKEHYIDLERQRLKEGIFREAWEINIRNIRTDLTVTYDHIYETASDGRTIYQIAICRQRDVIEISSIRSEEITSYDDLDNPIYTYTSSPYLPFLEKEI